MGVLKKLGPPDMLRFILNFVVCKEVQRCTLSFNRSVSNYNLLIILCIDSCGKFIFYIEHKANFHQMKFLKK